MLLNHMRLGGPLLCFGAPSNSDWEQAKRLPEFPSSSPSIEIHLGLSQVMWCSEQLPTLSFEFAPFPCRT